MIGALTPRLTVIHKSIATPAPDLTRAATGVRHAQDDDLFRLLVDRVQDYAIFALTPRGHVASWNIGAQRLKGYTADEIIGAGIDTLFTPEDRASGQHLKELAEARRSGRARNRALS